MWDFAQDTDGDGLINALDNDSDGDGIQDGTELGYTAGVPYLSANGNTIKGTDGSVFVPDQDPSQVNNTDPLSQDTDMDGLVDGWIDDVIINGVIDIGEGEDLNLNGKWDIGLAVGPNNVYESNANDSDADDDGIMDGDETSIYLTDPMDWDSDDDGISDGTEVGYTLEDMSQGTDISAGHFIPDADPTTTTEPLEWDTDSDGLGDGFVDNGNGIDE